MARQSGLGRGLASLIPQNKKKANESEEANYFGARNVYRDDSLKSQANEKKEILQDLQEKIKSNEDGKLTSLSEIPVSLIVSNPFQPRLHFNKEKLQELALSIVQHGILQPLVVSKKIDGYYELIAGERRLEASKLAGLEKVPVIIKEVNDQTKLELALIENIQRHNLNAIEEAKAFKRLQEEFFFTQEAVAKSVGKSRSAVANIMRLLALPVDMQRAVQEGRLSEGHARTLVALEDPIKQRALFEMILKNNLSVRETEEKVREITVGGHVRKIHSTDPLLQEYANKVGSNLGTKVQIKKSKQGGSIIIEYYSPEELSALIDRLVTE